MLIALDYDGTYTLDKEFWNKFIAEAFKNNHDVICITMRYDNLYESTDVKNSIGKYCKVIFTSRKAKKEYLDTLGIYPDIWIDDNPQWIYINSI